jgi:NAD-dependent dihydropyrimidine dehydrogenase PreA subunit
MPISKVQVQFITNMKINDFFKPEINRRKALVEGQVVPETDRCVQCGICSFYCPINIDVRRHVWLGVAVKDSHCLTCGECISRCPRGVLRFETTRLFGSSTR